MIKNPLRRPAVLMTTIALVQALTGLGTAQSAENPDVDASAPQDHSVGPPSDMQRGTITRNGVKVEFTLSPADGTPPGEPLGPGRESGAGGGAAGREPASFPSVPGAMGRRQTGRVA